MKKILYHGTDTGIIAEDLDFDFSDNGMIGFHLGTFRAAVERANKNDETVPEWSDEQIEEFYKMYPESILECDVTIEAPYNGGEPVSEDALLRLDREGLLADGFDSLCYINDFEDAGSISWIILKKENIG